MAYDFGNTSTFEWVEYQPIINPFDFYPLGRNGVSYNNIASTTDFLHHFFDGYGSQHPYSGVIGSPNAVVEFREYLGDSNGGYILFKSPIQTPNYALNRNINQFKVEFEYKSDFDGSIFSTLHDSNNTPNTGPTQNFSSSSGWSTLSYITNFGVLGSGIRIDIPANKKLSLKNVRIFYLSEFRPKISYDTIRVLQNKNINSLTESTPNIDGSVITKKFIKVSGSNELSVNSSSGQISGTFVNQNFHTNDVIGITSDLDLYIEGNSGLGERAKLAVITVHIYENFVPIEVNPQKLPIKYSNFSVDERNHISKSPHVADSSYGYNTNDFDYYMYDTDGCGTIGVQTNGALTGNAPQVTSTRNYYPTIKAINKSNPDLGLLMTFRIKVKND